MVDHIDGNPKNNERSNLRAMARRCHNARTLRDQVGRALERREESRGPTAGRGANSLAEMHGLDRVLPSKEKCTSLQMPDQAPER